MGIEMLAKNQMHIVPSSPELASGKFYACSVDVCEVGIQFCNVLDSRCVYCSDHHHDCFTNVQQQNCTLYCQEFPTSLTPGKFYICFQDVCQEGLQFCNRATSVKRCEYCNAYFHACFTYHQQVNCTQYCMDQWRQNTIYQMEKDDHKSNLYQVLFFSLLGICCLSAFVILVSCFPSIHLAIFSKLNRISTNRQDNFGQRARRPLNNLPTVTVPNNLPETGGIEVPAVQINATRQEAEGRSHTEREESEEIRRRNGNTTHRPEVNPSTAEGGPHIARTESEEIRHENGNTTRQSEISPNTSRKQFISQRHNSQTYQKMDVDQTTPFLSSSKNDTRLNPLKGDSVNGGVPHNELSSAGSSGYQALRHCPSTNDDTGYRSASRCID